jgi:cytochrome P450
LCKAYEDDVIPLSDPIYTTDGQCLDSIFVAKGTVIHVPIVVINRSEVLWGENAKDFDPSRWLDGSISQQKASEIQGYNHLLTFGGGHRACLGRTFALTEIKVN